MRGRAAITAALLTALVAVAACRDFYITGAAPPSPSDGGADGRAEGGPVAEPCTGAGEAAAKALDLRAYVGGRDVALVFRTVPGATTYTVYRDGVRVGTTPAPATGARVAEATSYVDADVVRGQGYRYAVEAGPGAGGCRSAEVSVTPPEAGTAVPEITVDASAAPARATWLERARGYLETWYPKIGDLLAAPDYAPPIRFTLRVLARPCPAVAPTGAGVVAICEDAADAPEDMGALVREATHLVQSYDAAHYHPALTTDGIASWAADLATGRSAPAPAASSVYADGGDASAYFLAWVARTRSLPSFLHDLNVAEHSGAFDPGIFARKTSQTLPMLWTEMTGRRVSSPGRVQSSSGKCGGLAAASAEYVSLQPCATTGPAIGLEEVVLGEVPDEPTSVQLHLGGRCLAVNETSIHLVLRPCNPAVPAQRWRFADGTLTNPARGECVQPSAGVTTDGTNLVVTTCNAGGLQQWTGPKLGE